jgi:hypothetical protein
MRRECGCSNSRNQSRVIGVAPAFRPHIQFRRTATPFAPDNLKIKKSGSALSLTKEVREVAAASKDDLGGKPKYGYFRVCRDPGMIVKVPRRATFLFVRLIRM